MSMRAIFVPTALAASLLSIVWITGCGAQAANTGVACAGRDMTNVCPVGTIPSLDADANAMCAGGGSVDVVRQAGEVAGTCASAGRCQVFCSPDPNFRCENGIQTITRESVICNAGPAGCANGTRDPGETGGSCPLDCSGVCEPSQERCNGSRREICNLRGQWETVACVENERCVETGTYATTCAAGSGFTNQAQMQVQQPQNPSQQQMQVQQPVYTNSTTNNGGAPQGTSFACDEATFDCVQIATGFLPDPLSVPGRSGGAEQYSECSGYFASNPDHVIYLDTDFNWLRVALDSATGPTTMIMAALDGSGSIYCSQPVGGALPEFRRSFRAGPYGIWIGSQTGANVFDDYRLMVTERR